MNKTSFTILSLLCTTGLSALAQNGIRMPDPYEQLNRRDKTRLQSQASNIFNAAEPVVKQASESTVAVNSRGTRVAFGTAIRTKDTKVAVLTKWSEVSNPRAPLTVTTLDGKTYQAKVQGVYPDHDLALLSTKAPLKPLDLTASANPELGSFLVLARPDGKVEGIGVVSVLTRSLRDQDKAYLGVMMDFSKASEKGVPLQRVMPKSAAQKAGLQNGDVIVSVDQTPIKGAMEMRNLLQQLKPGSEIIVRYRRGTVENNTSVKLGSRAENEDIRRVPRARMERMQRMGATPSRVNSDFPSVIQSDMPIDPNDAGAPVLNLEGKVIGIAIARGSRIKTFVTPTETLQRVLAFDPVPVSQALAIQPKARNNRNRIAPNSGSMPTGDDPAAKVRRLLSEIEKNNQQNRDILREVEEQLRNMERNEQNGR